MGWMGGCGGGKERVSKRPCGTGLKHGVDTCANSLEEVVDLKEGKAYWWKEIGTSIN